MGRKDIGAFICVGNLVRNRIPIRDFCLENEKITSSRICSVIRLEEVQDSRVFGRSKKFRYFRST